MSYQPYIHLIDQVSEGGVEWTYVTKTEKERGVAEGGKGREEGGERWRETETDRETEIDNNRETET